MPDHVHIGRALISVSDKTGLADLGRALAARGVEIVSTGGTATALRAAGVAVRDVSELTGWPEMMGGRVKTLHPGVHGGLLALRDDAEHLAAMAAHGIGPIDLLVVNLYPFEAARARGAGPAETTEMIDVGGPAMIRAAAKNHRFVAVLTDPEDYAGLLAEMDARGGATGPELRARLAATAFGRTAAYDGAIAGWLAAQAAPAEPPRRMALAGRLGARLRYGENPHQRAELYLDGSGRAGVATARQVQGKELSFNNLADADAAFEAVAEFDPAEGAACVIVKHANPCGVALGPAAAEAYGRAFDCDPTSAFGGIVALNRPLDAETAERITEIFTEVVIAPDADAGALAAFARKPALRLLLTGALPDPAAPGRVLRTIAGGFLVQDRDAGRLAPADLRCVSARAPDAAELRDLAFAWRVAKHVKSNAIVYARDGATVGIGAGQMSRIDSTRIAAAKAADLGARRGLGRSAAVGSVVASDAFFPFADGVLAAAEAGARAIIHPGGSMRDAEVIAAADAAGLAMVLTGMRHFRH
ncbi:MAG: bifunctional phosphoribosylaminoimidazolecarboxamide formyltransferase/IMP cyclohydrolase [Gemmobacter sp.]